MSMQKSVDLFKKECPICLAQIKADSEGRGLTMEEYITAAREAMKSGDFC